MDAAVDYAAAKAFLDRPLPAYVAYTAHTHVKFDAVKHDDSRDLVVRTSDGVIVKGSRFGGTPGAVHIGSRGHQSMEPVKQPAFDPQCYAATGARIENYEGRDLEAIALDEHCDKDKDDKDFGTLYVDPRSHEPIAAVGTDDDEHVSARLVQNFGRFGDHVLPSSFLVRVKGSGMMFWLDLTVDMRFDDYRFTNTEP